MSSENQNEHSEFYLFDDKPRHPDFVSKSDLIGIYFDTCSSKCEICSGKTLCRFLDFVGSSGQMIVQKSLKQEDFSMDNIKFKFESIGKDNNFTFNYLISYRYTNEKKEYYFRIAFHSKEDYLKTKEAIFSSTTDAKNHV